MGATKTKPARDATRPPGGATAAGSDAGDATIAGGGTDSRARLLFARVRRSPLGVVRGRAKLAAGLAIVAAFYLAAPLADFIAPYDYREQSRAEPHAPPTPIRFFDREGRFHLRPFIHPRRLVDPMERRYEEDAARAYPLALLPRGRPYKLLGLFTTDRHLFGVSDANQQDPRKAPDAPTSRTPDAPASRSVPSSSGRTAAPRVYLLGTDDFGRDRFSRLLAAARFSLAVGPLGTLLAGLLGVLVGCVSGYAGRLIDAVLMRAADAMMALPALVLILAARAALPLDLPPLRAGAFIVVIFVAVGWAEMARLTRGLVLELRSREFVTAAVALGMTEARVLFRHVLPNAARPILVQASLMLPAFLLAETALSYLGVGVQEPEASWGNMLAEAGNLSHLREQPLVILAPAFAIFLFVLGVRLVGDGLRRDDTGGF
jgi:peptide/nickel transport system permease protein